MWPSSSRRRELARPKGPMEQHRDEHIVCASCGATFIFSASEAAVFAERGLASPKRCKDCRRARKERAPGQESNGNSSGYARSGAPGAGGGPRGFGARPRYTGDVNEYRSPMQDSYSPAPAYGGRRAPGVARSGGAPSQGPARSDGYTDRMGLRSSPARSDGRSDRRGQGPAPWANGAATPGPRGQARSGAARGGHPVAHHDGDRAVSAQGDQGSGAPGWGRGAAPPASRHRRPQAEMFSITCNSCGVSAEVPFRPAEGREVFCQACYRARKPA